VTADDLRVPPGVLLLFGATLAFLLLIAALALVPARALPVRVSAVVTGRREELLFVALCMVGVGVVVLLLVALAAA
jgi:hypothetical protein